MDDMPVYSVTKDKDGEIWIVTTIENGRVTYRKEFTNAELADQHWKEERRRLQLGW